MNPPLQSPAPTGTDGALEAPVDPVRHTTGKKKEAKSRPKSRAMRFIVPFVTVLANYALGVGTFAVMAASDAPDDRSVQFFVGFAAEYTFVFAVMAAIAAGRWWYGKSAVDQ